MSAEGTTAHDIDAVDQTIRQTIKTTIQKQAKDEEENFTYRILCLFAGMMSVTAQDDKDYRTMSAEQLQQKLNEATEQLKAAQKDADKAHAEMKDAEKVYKDYLKRYEEYHKIESEKKSEVKKYKKAIKLRSKLSKL